jgi:stress response protein SCP2
LDKIITEKTELEDWVKMKITRVEQNMVDVKKSLEGWEKFSEGGELVKKQLLHIAKYSKDLIDMIQKGSKLMSWQENKLAVSSDYIDNVYHHLDYQMGNRASDIKKMNAGGLSEVSDMLPSPLPMSTIQPMAYGGDVDFVEKVKMNDLCIATLIDFVNSITQVKDVFLDDTDHLIFFFNELPTVDILEDMNLFIQSEEVTGEVATCLNVFTGDVNYQASSPYIIRVGLVKDSKFTNLDFAEGGSVPNRDKMFELPLEMVVYVPSTQDVNKVISVDEMDARVDEVKNYLASKFGGYTSSDKIGGFVDSNGNLVNEEITQVVAFSTKEAFEDNKKELIQKLAKWGKKWGQEAIGFEFEGDLLYVPQADEMKQGGELWIQDAVAKMKENATEGAFTRQAKRHGKTPVEFAKEVLKNPKNYRTTTLRRANFVRNTNPEKF